MSNNPQFHDTPKVDIRSWITIGIFLLTLAVTVGFYKAKVVALADDMAKQETRVIAIEATNTEILIRLAELARDTQYIRLSIEELKNK